MANHYQTRKPSGKLSPSAIPDRLRSGSRALEPRVPITRGSFFYPIRIFAVLAFFAGVWLLSSSGITRIDL